MQRINVNIAKKSFIITGKTVNTIEEHVCKQKNKILKICAVFLTVGEII